MGLGLVVYLTFSVIVRMICIYAIIRCSLVAAAVAFSDTIGPNKNFDFIFMVNVIAICSAIFFFFQFCLPT